MSQFFKGFICFFRSIGVINKFNLWGYIWIPFLISSILGVFFFVVGFFSTYILLHDFLQLWLTKMFSEMNFMVNTLEILLYLVLAVLIFLGGAFLYRPVATIIMLPFLNSLFDRLEKEMQFNPEGKKFQINPMLLFIGIYINIKYLLLEILALIISPFTGPFQPFFLLFVQGYFLGRSSFDYIASEQTTELEERDSLIKKYKMETWGLGVAQFLLLFIPLLGVILSPLMGVIGSYLLYVEGERN